MNNGENSVATTVEAGVAAYLSTREGAATIMEAVRVLSGGERERLSRRVAGALLQGRKPSGALDVLTDREREVLRLMAKGYSNATIGEDVHLSRAAVKKHASSIYGKLDIRRQESVPKFTHPRVMAAVKAERNGLI